MMLGALVAGCAPGLPSQTEFDQAADAEIARRPQDYVNGEARAFAVRRDGQMKGLLWGTIHIGYADATVMPADIRRLFAGSASLSVEEVLDQQSTQRAAAFRQLRKRTFYTPDPAVLAALPAETWQALYSAGMTDADIEKLTLTGLSTFVTNRASSKLPGVLPRGEIVDMNLVRFARSAAIPVHALEEIDAAMVEAMHYGSPNGTNGAAALAWTLRRRERLSAFSDWVDTQYGNGAIARASAGLNTWEATRADLARHDARRAALLTDRNRSWIAAIETRMTEADKPAFIAFGCSHLLGDDGVVALLRAKGWTVTPCLGDRCGSSA